MTLQKSMNGYLKVKFGISDYIDYLIHLGLGILKRRLLLMRG